MCGVVELKLGCGDTHPALMAGKKLSCARAGISSQRLTWPLVKYWGWVGCCPHSTTLFCLEGSLQFCLFFLGHKSTALFQGALPDARFLPQVVIKFICVSDPGSLSEEPVVARKPETLETAQPAAENQEMLHGQSSSTNSLQQSSEHCPTVEQAPASDAHTGPLPAVKTEQERLEMKTISPEGSCSQQEIQKAKQEDGSCVKDVVRKKS